VGQPVILSKLEQEYLLRIVESAIEVGDLREFFLWSQGQLQALLPHRLMVCLLFDHEGVLRRVEPLHASILDTALLARLCDAEAGLALRLARHCGAQRAMPAAADLNDLAPVFGPFQAELDSCGFENLIMHGSGPVAGGATVFLLFGLPMKPGARHLYFLSLLLPQLHLALVRLARQPALRGRGSVPAGGRELSAREGQIVHWLREGKKNADIAAILGISEPTVKNHLQRIYKLLGVHNRTEAVTRCIDHSLLAKHK